MFCLTAQIARIWSAKSAYFAGFDEPLTFSNHFLRLRPQKDALDGSFLARFLVSEFQHGTFEALCTRWVNQAAVRKDDLLSLEIPLPPLAEQQRLAAILDGADALRALRRDGVAALDELAQSLFLELFGDPAMNPKNWEMVKLGDYAPVVTSGSTPLGGNATYLTQGIMFIRSQNVLMNEFDFSDAAFIGHDVHHKMKRTWVKNGDVLFNITGASIGRVHYFQGEDNTANVNQHVCIIRTDKSNLLPIFLSNYLATDSFQISKVAENNGATRQAFNFQQIRDFQIPLPPLALQQEFATQIGQLETLKARARAQAVELDALFAALSARAFAGELSD